MFLHTVNPEQLYLGSVSSWLTVPSEKRLKRLLSWRSEGIPAVMEHLYKLLQ